MRISNSLRHQNSKSYFQWSSSLGIQLPDFGFFISGIPSKGRRVLQPHSLRRKNIIRSRIQLGRKIQDINSRIRDDQRIDFQVGKILSSVHLIQNTDEFAHPLMLGLVQIPKQLVRHVGHIDRILLAHGYGQDLGFVLHIANVNATLSSEQNGVMIPFGVDANVSFLLLRVRNKRLDDEVVENSRGFADLWKLQTVNGRGKDG